MGRPDVRRVPGFGPVAVSFCHWFATLFCGPDRVFSPEFDDLRYTGAEEERDRYGVGRTTAVNAGW
jgi:hypothetical protein